MSYTKSGNIWNFVAIAVKHIDISVVCWFPDSNLQYECLRHSVNYIKGMTEYWLISIR